MKAITLWQPWASLMSWGVKRIETRSWRTDYRGELAITASARIPSQIQEWWAYGDDPAKELIVAELRRRGLVLQDLPCGAVLCTVDLLSVARAHTVIDQISRDERLLGDYRLGRYAWFTRGRPAMAAPVPCKGRRGLWDWDPTETRRKTAWKSRR